jgi:hypothetical protein
MDQYNGGRGGCDRHYRMHDDAELAVIRVGRIGVQMRDLGYG